MNKRGKECTRVMNRFASGETNVSNQTQNNCMHVIESNRVNQSYIVIKSIDQLINHKITYVGPLTKAHLFCMN